MALCEGKVDKNTIFSEYYNEMRRYRDYQLQVATWYTTFLLAILGGIASLKENGSLNKFLGDNYEFIIFLGVTFLALSASISILHAHYRYEETKLLLKKDVPRSNVKSSLGCWLSLLLMPHCFLIATFIIVSNSTIYIVSSIRWLHISINVGLIIVCWLLKYFEHNGNKKDIRKIKRTIWRII